MDSLTNALRKGNYSDERFEIIDMQLQLIKTGYNTYINSLAKPQECTSMEPDLKGLGNLFDNFKNKFDGKTGNSIFP